MNRERFFLAVPQPTGGTVTLCGIRLPRPGSRPLILHPGFSQSGDVWDLIPGELSLADYLWTHGFDIWIIDQRGTGGSNGARMPTSLDALAACDIPYIIDYVSRRTVTPPIFVGHSEGGIAAILSMLGVTITPNGTPYLSDEQCRARQESLHGLVTLGSFPNMTGEGTAWLRTFVGSGVRFKIFGMLPIRLPFGLIYAVFNLFNFWSIPFPHRLREQMFETKALRWILFPFGLVAVILQHFPLITMLYVRANVGAAAIEALVYRTVYGIYRGIVDQYVRAVQCGTSVSADGRVVYGDKYERITLPMSVVTMEYCTFADPVATKREMVDHLGSARKTYVMWPGVGHEDHFMNTKYFEWVLAAIQAVA